MTMTEPNVMGIRPQPYFSPADSQALGRVVSGRLRQIYPHHSAKQVAAAISCAPKTAENVLSGHLSVWTLTLLINALGPGWVAECVMAAAEASLTDYIRAQADQAHAEALRHQEQARELDQLESTLRTSRQTLGEGGAGRVP